MNARAAAALLLTTLLLTAAAGAPPTYEVVIEEGLNPRMSPSTVAAMASSEAVRSVLGGGDEPPLVTRVKCIEGDVIREAFSHPSMKNAAPIWVVRMRGRFVNHRAAGEARVAESAYILVDDADGRIIAFGSTPGREGARPPTHLPFPPPSTDGSQP